MQDAVDLGYSYTTCDSEDSFTQFYNLRDGVVQLCSVFAQDAAPSGGAGGRPCGATHTHRQVAGDLLLHRPPLAFLLFFLPVFIRTSGVVEKIEISRIESSKF